MKYVGTGLLTSALKAGGFPFTTANALPTVMDLSPTSMPTQTPTFAPSPAPLQDGYIAAGRCCRCCCSLSSYRTLSSHPVHTLSCMLSSHNTTPHPPRPLLPLTHTPLSPPTPLRRVGWLRRSRLPRHVDVSHPIYRQSTLRPSLIKGDIYYQHTQEGGPLTGDILSVQSSRGATYGGYIISTVKKGEGCVLIMNTYRTKPTQSNNNICKALLALFILSRDRHSFFSLSVLLLIVVLSVYGYRCVCGTCG